MGLPKEKLELIQSSEAEDITEIFATWLTNFPSQHTRRAYKTDFFKFFNFVSSQNPKIKNFGEITPFIVSAYRDFLISQKKANKTINRKLATISSFLTALVAEQKIRSNPVVCRRPPSETIRVKTWLNNPEAERVLETFNKTTPSGKMNYLLTKTLYQSAQRFSSIANLKAKDLAEMNDFLVITIELKGGRKKALPLPRVLSGELKSYVKDEELNPEDYLFTGKKGVRTNKPIDNKSFNEVLRVAGRRAKLKKVFTSHRLRASTLSDLIRKGYGLPRIQAQVSFHRSADTLLIYQNEREYEDLETNLLLETENKTVPE
jgi:site-specific recombinase XerD